VKPALGHAAHPSSGEKRQRTALRWEKVEACRFLGSLVKAWGGERSGKDGGRWGEAQKVGNRAETPKQKGPSCTLGPGERRGLQAYRVPWEGMGELLARMTINRKRYTTRRGKIGSKKNTSPVEKSFAQLGEKKWAKKPERQEDLFHFSKSTRGQGREGSRVRGKTSHEEAIP